MDPSTLKDQDPMACNPGDQDDYGDYEDDEQIEDEQDDQPIEKEILLSNSVVGYGPNIEKKAQILGVSWRTDNKNNANLILKGGAREVAKMVTFLHEIEEAIKDPFASKIVLGDSITKEVAKTKGFNKFKGEIEKMADKLEVFLEVNQEKIVLVGYQRRVNELIAFMYEKEAEFELGDFIQQELNISTFHRAYKKQIEETAISFGLACEFGYDMITVAGLQKNVDELILYLLELESQVKRNLFPKYWDFTQKHSYCLIPVLHTSEEFFMVSELFHQTMKNDLISVTRVQNKYVMDHYICMLQKRMELNMQEAANRKLLFYGSKTRKAADIYGNFDIGFDIQYGFTGQYGWGLYFSEKASTVAGDAFLGTSTGSNVLILADVFIGKPWESLPQVFVKPPEGHDCVKSKPVVTKKTKSPDTLTYVLYNNFYSYPLYIVEYR